MDRKIVVIAHNIRSTHNVGSLLRTADGMGIEKVCLSGYTPYPALKNDERLPHMASKINSQIKKTALGAELSMEWEYTKDILSLLTSLKKEGYTIAALEQTSRSIALPSFKPPAKIAFILGREVEGLEQYVLDLAELFVEIPMSGKKESYNVVIAAAMAVYHCRYYENLC